MPERFVGEYIWFWSALGTSFATYIPLFLFRRGIIELPDPNKRWKMTLWRRRSETSEQERAQNQERNDAYDMLA
jgi:hypothetical protein